MDSGLSARMQQTLKELGPGSAVAPPNHPSNVIDLSSAQNEVLRPELLEFFKSTVQDKVSAKEFALPPANGGDPQARQALAAFFNNHFDPIHAVKPEHIVLTAGASDAIENVIHAICDDGDSILVPGPLWHGFAPILKSKANVNMIVAQPPTYENYDNYLIPSLRAVYDFSADRSRIKAVLICNPQNPLGRCYDRKSLLELMEFCQENELHLIVDEMYALTNLSTAPAKAPSFVSALSLTEPLPRSGAVKVDPSRVHVIWSASKLFGMSGFRVGCLISQSSTPLLSSLSLLTAQHTSLLSTFTLSSLLTSPLLPSFLSLTTSRLSANFTTLASALRTWNVEFVTPSHGIFVFARLARTARCAADEQRFYEELEGKTGVRIAQGRAFKGAEGSFGWGRVRFSVEEEVLKEVVRRVGGFLEGR